MGTPQTVTSNTLIAPDPPAPKLLERLKAMGASSRSDVNTMLLVSISALPTGNAPEDLWIDLQRTFIPFKQRYSASVYHLSMPERAVLVKTTEFNKIGMLTDLKVELLRLIQQYFPQHFGTVDQSRLIRTIDLRMKLPSAIKVIERFDTPAAAAAATTPAPEPERLRPLTESDIAMVTQVSDRVGKDAFARVFVRNQRLVEIQPGGSPTEVMNEYYIGMDMLKKHVFPNVELRGSANLFNQLTIVLDRILLDAFNEVNPQRVKCSVNLNVESVFTRTFEAFLGQQDEQAFANIVFEFRQANVLQHFDEYEVASTLIKSRGGTIAVDAIFPETVGIVNLSRVHATMAKIFWRNGAETVLPQYQDHIKAMQDAGISVVIARLDDETGVEIGHSLGITLYQGFHVDKLVGAT